MQNFQFSSDKLFKILLMTFYVWRLCIQIFCTFSTNLFSTFSNFKTNYFQIRAVSFVNGERETNENTKFKRLCRKIKRYRGHYCLLEFITNAKALKRRTKQSHVCVIIIGSSRATFIKGSVLQLIRAGRLRH